MYYTTNIRAAFTFELWMNATTALKFSWDSNHVRILTLNHRAGKKKCSTCYSHMRQSHISDAGVTLRKLLMGNGMGPIEVAKPASVGPFRKGQLRRHADKRELRVWPPSGRRPGPR